MKTRIAQLEAQAGQTEKRVDRIEATLERLVETVGELCADLRLLRTEMNGGFAQVKSASLSLRTEVKGDIASLPSKSDMRDYLISGLILAVAVFGLTLAGASFPASHRTPPPPQPVAVQAPIPAPSPTSQ